ncbi:HEAT repeat domain-containing protein [Paenibacillus aurantius]|uniref:HEAT repeat domain-containing protein n=1 Tax=Paenibacillus aurantius TaxID=2918900 RepID=A0AA96RDH9_9BACL|nr:HEAT repeat domain-containing protein [Paenibacillus aurantius]WNQ09852.1 HEAT repeat domain-containing protein [Paenibacillus aurantius]
MSKNEELTGYGRQYLQNDTYGAAAFCFHRAIRENVSNENAWNGIILSLTLMKREADAQTMLARYGLLPQLGYDQDMLTFAVMLWRENPQALAEWLNAVSSRQNVTETTRNTLTELSADVEKAYQELLAEYGEESLRAQGLFKLQEYASRQTELDWTADNTPDAVYAQINEWLQDDDKVLTAVRLLCMLPDPRSEKLLRRVCRNEEMDPKARTHALLALRWLGLRENVRINKFKESFVINLENPEPELTVSVPESFKPALDRMKLWYAKEQGVVSAEEYEAFASTDEAEMPAELKEKMEKADVPSILQEVVHALIRSAYDHYYPLVPTVTGSRDWSAAFVSLMKDYSEGIGEQWTMGEPERNETSGQHKNWLLSGSPDFYESIAEAKKLREFHQAAKAAQR